LRPTIRNVRPADSATDPSGHPPAQPFGHNANSPGNPTGPPQLSYWLTKPDPITCTNRISGAFRVVFVAAAGRSASGGNPADPAYLNPHRIVAQPPRSVKQCHNQAIRDAKPNRARQEAAPAPI